AEDLHIGRVHLLCADDRRHSADAGAQTRADHTADRCRLLLVLLLHQAQHSAERKIGVDCLANVTRNTHSRGADQPGYVGIARLDKDGLADRQFAVPVAAENGPQTLLDLRAEAPSIDEVDTPRHEAEAVRRADDRVNRDAENVASRWLH